MEISSLNMDETQVSMYANTDINEPIIKNNLIKH